WSSDVCSSDLCTRSFAESGDDVDDAFRNSSVEKNFAEAKRSKRRLFGGFKDDAISSRERRREFPRGHEQRKIPRNDLANDADRLAQRERVKLAAGRVGHADGNGVAFNLRRPAGHVVKNVRRKWNVRDASDGAGLAVVERFELSKFVRVFENEIADFPNEFAAFARRQATPRAGLERAPGRAYRAIDVFFAAVGNAGNHRGIGGIKHIQKVSRCGGGPTSPDEILFWFFEPRSNARANFNFSAAGNVAVDVA